MKNDCSIVDDLLPLYVEGMVNDDTAAFVREHLDGCERCRGEYEKMKSDGGELPTGETAAYAEEAAPMQNLKRKLKRRQLRAIGVTVALVLAVLLAIAWMRPVVIEYGASELYSEAEMEEAVALIDKEFNSWKGCRLYYVEYAGDELCERELDYCNTLAPEGMTYADCIVFRTDFRSPIFGGGAWNANQRYHWSWYLARTEGGAWELLTWGAP